MVFSKYSTLFWAFILSTYIGAPKVMVDLERNLKLLLIAKGIIGAPVTSAKWIAPGLKGSKRVFLWKVPSGNMPITFSLFNNSVALLYLLMIIQEQKIQLKLWMI